MILRGFWIDRVCGDESAPKMLKLQGFVPDKDRLVSVHVYVYKYYVKTVLKLTASALSPKPSRCFGDFVNT